MQVGRQGFVLQLAVTLLTLAVATVTSASMFPAAHAAVGRLAPMPTPRDVPAAAVVGSSIYVFGGMGAETTVEAYDTVTNIWATKAPMPTGRYSMGAAVSPDGKIYVVGGYPAYTVVEAYNPQTNSWETKPPIPDGGHSEHAVVADAQGRIYAIGGSLTSGLIHRFDPATSSWTSPTSLPHPRIFPAAALGPDGAIYVLGGTENSLGQMFGLVERYDPTADSWTTMAPMPTPRQAFGAVFGPNGHLYAFGGFFTQESPMTLEEYNPSTNT